jgi:hypothetical protein
MRSEAIAPAYARSWGEASLPGVPTEDDAICGPETCWPIVGKVLVWRDANHLTASYARTMVPSLEKVLATFVEGKVMSLEQLGYQTESATWREAFLMGAL